MRGSSLRKYGRGGDSQNYQQDLNNVKVRLGELDGSLGSPKKKEKASLVKGDISAIPLNQLKSKQITAAPTMEEYNVLQADVEDMHRTLSTILGKGEQ